MKNKLLLLLLLPSQLTPLCCFRCRKKVASVGTQTGKSVTFIIPTLVQQIEQKISLGNNETQLDESDNKQPHRKRNKNRLRRR